MKTSTIKLSIAIVGLSTVLLSSCGNKLYSYRKTVKVKDELANGTSKSGQTKIYMTVKEVKPEVTKSAAVTELNVDPNTIYNVTKPIPEKDATTTTSTNMLRATIR